MSFTQKLILDVPPLVLCAGMVLIAVLLSVGGTLITHRFVSHTRLKVHNDITGPIFGTLGVIYAVLLAFVVIIAWQNYDKAKINVEKEMNCLVNMYADVEPFQEPFRQQLRLLVGEYAKAAIDEWKVLGRGQENVKLHEVIDKIVILYTRYLPKTETDKIFLAESVGKLNELIELRVLRLMAARSGIHPVLWFVLIAGGTITIVFTIFFGSESLLAKITMSTLLAVTIALVLFTILEFDFPFTGKASISAEPFRQFLIHFSL